MECGKVGEHYEPPHFHPADPLSWNGPAKNSVLGRLTTSALVSDVSTPSCTHGRRKGGRGKILFKPPETKKTTFFCEKFNLKFYIFVLHF